MHTENVHVDISGHDLEWGVNKEMERWKMEGRLELLSCVDDDVDEYSDD